MCLTMLQIQLYQYWAVAETQLKKRSDLIVDHVSTMVKLLCMYEKAESKNFLDLILANMSLIIKLDFKNTILG